MCTKCGKRTTSIVASPLAVAGLIIFGAGVFAMGATRAFNAWDSAEHPQALGITGIVINESANQLMEGAGFKGFGLMRSVLEVR